MVKLRLELSIRGVLVLGGRGMYTSVCMGLCVWRPEEDVWCCAQSLSVLLL